MARIQPDAKAVYLEGSENVFTRQYPKDTMICSENEPGTELYIIQKGRVKITKVQDESEILLSVLKTGDIFGEMALLTNDSRSASAIAYDDVVLLVVNKSNFQKMVQSQAQLITRLTQLLAERIWAMYKQLANSTMSDPLGRLYDMLLLQMEKNRVPIAAGTPYTFEFGPQELTNMVGLPMAQGSPVVKQLLDNQKLKLVDNRIYVSDGDEIKRQSEYYKKMDSIQSARKAKARQRA